MLMDYFRRSVISGNALQRVPFPTVRGNLRRSDADSTSAVPYFPSVIAGDTLILSLDGTTHTITLTSSSLAQIITDINAALGGLFAFDADGTLQLQSNTAGVGSVKVTGGTAASKTGFNLTLGPVLSLGGDLPSAPEGRVGNLFGSVFPIGGENFSSESFLRGLGIVSGNSDVLFSDLAKERPVMQKIASSEYLVSADGSQIVLGATSPVRVFTGSPLSASSTKENLAPYFSIIDQTTGQPTSYRVVAVTNGDPGLTGGDPTDPPYANTAGWTANDGGNLLGQDVVKASLSISSIAADGRTVTVTGDLVGFGAQVGDYAEITGASNTNKWSNNGYRWAIESILSETVATLRPLSQAELSAVGQDLSVGNHPLVELSSDLSAGQSYGSLKIHTGNFANSVTLIVRPPLPINSTFAFDLYAMQPLSARGAQPWQVPESESFLARPSANDIDQNDNGIFGQPTVTFSSGSTYVVGPFWARWHGRIVKVPQTTVTVGSDEYIYWEAKNGRVTHRATSTDIFVQPSIPDPSNSSGGSFWSDLGQGFFIAKVSGATIEPLAKSLGSSPTSLTVGHGGNFQNLPAAVDHLVEMFGTSSPSPGFSGDWSHFEIVLLSDQVVTKPISVSVPYLKIRGASPDVLLAYDVSGTTAPFTGGWGSGTTNLILEDLVFGVVTLTSLQVAFTGFNSLTLHNVKQVTGGSWENPWELAQNVVTLRLDRCVLSLDTAVAGIGCTDISMRDSSITQGGLVFQIFTGASGVPTTGDKVSLGSVNVSNCQFVNLDSGTSILTLLYTQAGSYSFENCTFSFSNSNLSRADALLAKFHDSAIFTNCTFGTNCRRAVDVVSQYANVILDNCSATVAPATNGAAIRAMTVRNCVVIGIDPGAATTGSTGIVAHGLALGNQVTGSLAIGISTTNSVTSLNYVATTTSANLGALSACILPGDHAVITDNTVVVSSGDGIGDGYAGRAFMTVTNNHVIMSSGDASKGIHIAGNISSSKISGNRVELATGTAITGTIAGIYLDGNSSPYDPSDVQIDNNFISLGDSAGATGLVLSSSDNHSWPIIHNCYIRAYTAFSINGTTRLSSCYLAVNTQTLSGLLQNSYVLASGSGASLTLQDDLEIVGSHLDASGFPVNQQVAPGINATQTVSSSTIICSALSVFNGITDAGSLPGSSTKVFWNGCSITGPMSWNSYSDSGTKTFMPSLYSMADCLVVSSFVSFAGATFPSGSLSISGCTFQNSFAADCGATNLGGLIVKDCFFLGSVFSGGLTTFNSNTVNSSVTDLVLSGTSTGNSNFSGNYINVPDFGIELSGLIGSDNVLGDGSGTGRPAFVTATLCSISNSSIVTSGTVLLTGTFTACSITGNIVSTSQAASPSLDITACEITGGVTVDNSLARLTVRGSRIQGALSGNFDSGSGLNYCPPDVEVSDSYLLDNINLTGDGAACTLLSLINVNLATVNNLPHVLNTNSGSVFISGSTFGGSKGSTIADLGTGPSLHISGSVFKGSSTGTHTSGLVISGYYSLEMDSSAVTGSVDSTIDIISSIQIYGCQFSTRPSLTNTGTASVQVSACTLNNGITWVADSVGVPRSTALVNNIIKRPWNSDALDGVVSFPQSFGRVVITNNVIEADNVLNTTVAGSGFSILFPLLISQASGSIHRLTFENNTVRLTDNGVVSETSLLTPTAVAIYAIGTFYDCVFTGNFVEVPADTAHGSYTHAFSFVRAASTHHTTLWSGNSLVKSNAANPFGDAVSTWGGATGSAYRGALLEVDGTALTL